MNIGTQEMILILVVVLLLFGGKKLPEMARGLGKGIREFKDASEGIKREVSAQIDKANSEDANTPNKSVDQKDSAKDREDVNEVNP
ncbi:Sec-independent protein translocase subunit TatA/TatB [Sphingobacterium deserti]|nr:twin-arginine translocase TatA/TatE family subunit [Sphingobacterium deserti]